MKDETLFKIFTFLGLCVLAGLGLAMGERDLTLIIVGLLAGFLGIPAIQNKAIFYFRKKNS